MSHFLDRLHLLLARRARAFSDGHGVMTGEDRTWEDAYRKPLGARQDRALDPWRELHWIVLVEDLRQGRHRHLGDAADGLSAHALGPAQPRAARARAGYSWYLYSANRVKYPLVRGRLLKHWREARPRTTRWRPGPDRRTTRKRATTEACAAWAAWCARPGTRSTRSSPRPTSTPIKNARPGPRDRLFADPGDVDGATPRAAAYLS